MKIQEIINLFESYRNDENSSFIDGIILKINDHKMSEEERESHLNKILNEEKIVDENGNINKYMLERYIVVGMEREKKYSEYEKQNGEGSSKNSFVYQNGLVLLEKTSKGLPIELHIKEEFPTFLKAKYMTKLSKILQLAFCDALLKVRKQWIEDPTNFQGANELKLVSFMVNKATADFLNEISFNAQSVELEKTDYNEGPVIKKGKLTDEEYKKVCQRLEPYLFRYSVHRDANNNIVPSSQLGIATISKEKLKSGEIVEKILKKRKEILDYFKAKNVDIGEIDEKIVEGIPDFRQSTEVDKHIILKEEDFKENYGIDASDKLPSEGVREFANEEGVQAAKEDARRRLEGLCHIIENTKY